MFIPAFHAITNATRVTKSHNRARAARAVAMFLRRAAGEPSTVGAGRNCIGFAIHAKRFGTPIAVPALAKLAARRYSTIKVGYDRAYCLVSVLEPVLLLAFCRTVASFLAARAYQKAGRRDILLPRTDLARSALDPFVLSPPPIFLLSSVSNHFFDMVPHRDARVRVRDAGH